MRRPVRTVVCAAGAVAASAFPAGARATSLPARTFGLGDLSPAPYALLVPAADPALSESGAILGFDSPDAGGGRAVYTVNAVGGQRQLISATTGGQAAPGASIDPALSSTAATVAFVSDGQALVAGATAGTDQVYVSRGGGAPQLVSSAPGGGPGDGDSTEPVVSADGRFVAFASTAGNLVRGVRSGGEQVYLRDLDSGRTALVSTGTAGAAAGFASNPAISASGRFVSFDSSAANLAGGRHAAPQIFLRDLTRQRTTLVSVSSSGAAQNSAVTAPFRQVSSISADGSAIVFDSNATNLVRGDINRSTDIFLRRPGRHRTTLISVDDGGFEGNGASFDPTISADGAHVAFDSFASNLAPGGGPGENVFIRDLTIDVTSVVDVGPTGQRLSKERGGALLQRPALSGNGEVAAFESTAATLTGGDRRPHVFLRLLNAPEASFVAPPPARVAGSRVTLSVRADDPAAADFWCRIDRAVPFTCHAGRLTFAGLTTGRHTLQIRAGGPGMLYQATPLTAVVQVTR